MRLLLALMLLAAPARADEPPINLDWTPQLAAAEQERIHPLDALCQRLWRRRVDGAGLMVVGGLALGGAVPSTVQAVVAAEDGDLPTEQASGGLAAGLWTVGVAAMIAGPLILGRTQSEWTERKCAARSFARVPADDR